MTPPSESPDIRNSAGVRDIDALSRAFHWFGRAEAPQLHSPMYAELSYGVSADPELLALAAQTQPSQPPPNMLYAAVQYLLLRGAAHPLRDHYPSVSGSPRPPEPAFPLFRDFCLTHRDAILDLIGSRRTQTNVIQRCIVLVPAFAQIHAETGQPLALLEIGCSAGLNLLWDRYRYHYPAQPGAGPVRWGDPASPVPLDTELRGDTALPHLPATIPVAWRHGVDVSPIDPRDEDAVLWLRSLIWPEHPERHQRLLAAVAVAAADPPPIATGDALDLTPTLGGQAPPDATLVVVATFVMYQLPPQRRVEFVRGLQRLSASLERRIDFVSFEGTGDGDAELALTTYRDGARTTRTLARANPHGRWLEWRDHSTA